MWEVILLGVLNAGIVFAWFKMLEDGMIFAPIKKFMDDNSQKVVDGDLVFKSWLHKYIWKITVGCPYCAVVYLNLATDPLSVVYITGISYLVLSWILSH